MTKIYHNPQCSKCRQTIELLAEKNIDAEVIEYLKTPPSIEELTEILTLLKLEPRELMRQHEKEYKTAGLDNGNLTREQLIQGMVDNPKLIERPIVINNGRAAIGRPPVNILDIL